MEDFLATVGQGLVSQGLWALLISALGNVVVFRLYTKTIDNQRADQIERDKAQAAASDKRYDQNERFIVAIQGLSAKIDGFEPSPRPARRTR